MIGLNLFRRLALPRGDGPSLAANSDSELLGQLPPSFPPKLASLVAALLLLGYPLRPSQPRPVQG
jgi:hypothetical protein